MNYGPHRKTFKGDKNRIKKKYYWLKQNNNSYRLSFWNGKQLINKDPLYIKKIAEYNKKWREKNKEYVAKKEKEYSEKNKEKRAKYNKEWREKNKEYVAKKAKEYSENNKEKKSKYHRLYSAKNKYKLKEYHKKYYQENREKLVKKSRDWEKNNRERRNKRNREKRANDSKARIKHLLKTRIGSILKANGAAKNKRSMEYYGCTVEHFYNYIESLFTDGMNWDNQGKKAQDGRGWELDHRRPCASFDFNDEEQIHMCFHWTNYQPLWSADNNKKSDSYNPDTFEYKWSGRETGWQKI